MNQQTVEAPARSNRFTQPEFQREEILRAWKRPASATRPAEKKAPAKDSPARTGLREIIFNLVAPSARTVLLAGEFTDWEKAPLRMQKIGRGVWQAKVFLPPGRTTYRFLVDGNWQNDPLRTELVPNPFGTHNNVMEVS